MKHQPAIIVEGIGKKYRIGVRDERYTNFREALQRMITMPIRRFRALREHGDEQDTIWALRDVSFEVKPGEVLGIIGRNGAGKTTLLKVLSRITEPTTGEARLRGRIASLLEVGTGFHPELSGRENIYLNGAILGMTKGEIDRRFDEIVAFSEIGKFLDTPVKRYSSGMYVRLAFAVAAHLDPEILIVDEVLAVGDATFQRRCLGKMGEVATAGRTVLLVSHNMGAITQLCGRALWVDEGAVRRDGDAAAVVSAYLSEGAGAQAAWENPAQRPDNPRFHMRTVSVTTADGEPGSIVPFRDEFQVHLDYEVRKPLPNASVLCRVTDPTGHVIWTSWDTDSGWDRSESREPGSYRSTCHVPGGLLRPGRYHIGVGALIRGVTVLSSHECVLTFDVSAVGFPFNEGRVGVITPSLIWEVRQADDSAAGRP